MSNPTGSTETVKRESKPRTVQYGLEIVDDLPDPVVVRHSPLEDALEKIVEDPKFHGKWVRIGEYDNGSAASASSNVLRQRHGGNPTVEGFTFQAKRFNKMEKVGDKDIEVPKTGLFVKYTPAAIVQGAREEWDRKELARITAINAKRAEAGKDPLPLPKAASNGGTVTNTGQDAKPGTPAQKGAAGAGTGATSTEQKAKP